MTKPPSLESVREKTNPAVKKLWAALRKAADTKELTLKETLPKAGIETQDIFDLIDGLADLDTIISDGVEEVERIRNQRNVYRRLLVENKIIKPFNRFETLLAPSGKDGEE